MIAAGLSGIGRAGGATGAARSAIRKSAPAPVSNDRTFNDVPVWASTSWANGASSSSITSTFTASHFRISAILGAVSLECIVHAWRSAMQTPNQVAAWRADARHKKATTSRAAIRVEPSRGCK